MGYRKDIIVITGGRNKGVVKLTTASGRNGYLKGTCALDFAPRSGILYVVSDKIAEIEVKSRDFAFEIPDFAQKNISCVLTSAVPTMFGTNDKSADRSTVIAKIEKYKSHKKRENAASDESVVFEERKEEETAAIDKAEEPEEKETLERPETATRKDNEPKRENMKNLKKDEYAGAKAEVASDAALSVDGVSYEGNNFYQAIKPQLDEMFVCYPAEDALNGAVPNSSWVRIDTDDDYYVVGILFDLDAPSFICYGIPGTYDVQPPDELKEMCVWLPLNINDKFNDGYWVIYQSAVDGKIIR